MKNHLPNRSWLGILTGIAALCLALTAFRPLYDPAAGPKQRIVCFKFKADAPPEAVARHMSHFARLKEEIPLIVSYHAGKTLTGDKGAAPEYDVMHYMTFRTEADIEAYFGHAKHKEFIQANKAIWDKVLVINSNTGE